MSSSPVGSMTFGDHLCLPYDNDDERDCVLRTFVRDGLHAGHKVVCHPAEGRFDSVLDRMMRGADEAAMRAALAAGQLAVGPEEADSPGAADTALARTAITLALAQGYEGVRIVREPVGGTAGCGFQDVLSQPGLRAMAICEYDRRWFDQARLERLEACHDGRVGVNPLYDDGVLQITRLHAPPGLRLVGAIDESTVPALRSALNDVRGRGSHFCFDVSGLEFCDLEGFQVLVTAGRTGEAGLERQVVLRGVRSYLGLMVRMSPWVSMPGVFVEEAAG